MNSPEPNEQKLTRKQYQRQLQRKHQRVRRRRRARVRRVRLLRMVRTTQFWTRVSAVTFILSLFVFWSHFALVYNIPSFARRGPLVGVSAYVAVKPWWFGPPLFNLKKTASSPVHPLVGSDTYAILLQNLGNYQSIVEHPHFVWVQRLN